MRTPTVHAPNGMVCSVDHLASSAGVAALRAGGTAADAAVTASAVLAVTSPHMCGMGGDLFALVHHRPGRPDALCAAGRAGSGADPEAMRSEGLTEMPFRGDVRSVTVPGCVDGWLELHRRHGRLPLEAVLDPAIGYARDGFPASPILARASALVRDVEGAGEVGRDHLRAGGLVRRPRIADALTAVLADGRAGFYEGDFGAALRHLGGGLFTREDLARSQAEWVEPLVATAWDHDVWTVPPPSQGYLVLASAWIASGLDLPDDPDDPLTVHLLAEAARWAGHDRPEVLHDAADGPALVHPDRLESRRAAIDPARRTGPPSTSATGGTMYLCAADGDGMGVSLIQSNAADFGSHLVAPGTEVFLHNRGIGFSLEPGHPAELAPGRRPPHTLSPAVVTRRDGGLAMLVGTQGGDLQPQVVLQLLARTLRHRESPGRAVSAPRWFLGTGGFSTWARGGPGHLTIESSAPREWESLEARGHVVARAAPHTNVGHAHLIAVAEGGLSGASDPRAISGAAAGW